MKTSKKIIALILAALAAFVMLAACGGGNEGGGGGGNAAVKGSTQEWGNLSLFIPDGYSLIGGSLIDAEDPDSAWILLDSDNTHYFLIGVVDGKSDAEDSLDMTKEMNEANGGAGDVTLNAGGVSWTGYAYKYNSTDCFELYAEVGGKWVTVSSAYHAYDSDLTLAVLGGLTVK